MSRSLVALTALIAALAVSQPAFATDYCVNTACGGTNVPHLEDALKASAAFDDADRIFLGADTYVAQDPYGFQYNNSSGPVEIIGVGRGLNQTVLTSPAGGSAHVLWLRGGAGTSVRNMRIIVPPNAATSTYGLMTNGTASDLTVTADPAQVNFVSGVVLQGGTLENSLVG